MNWDYDTSYTNASGYGTDQTANLQNAINTATAAGKGLYITKPYGITIDGLTIPSNAWIKFLDGGGLRMLHGDYSNGYAMLLLDGVSNVTIENALLDGAKERNTTTGGESGMGISVYDSSNVTIIDPVIRNTWGDGIYLGGTNGNSNITIWRPDIAGVRRNGISVITANGLTIYKPTMANVTETNPKCGIDFEPNDNTNVLQNINVYSPTTIGCNLGLEFSIQGMVGSTAKTVSINVYDWTDIHSTDTALNRYDLAKGSYSISGSINIHNVKYVKSNILHDYAAPYDNSVTWSVTNETSIT